MSIGRSEVGGALNLVQTSLASRLKLTVDRNCTVVFSLRFVSGFAIPLHRQLNGQARAWSYLRSTTELPIFNAAIS
jgi:hypothetical protein